MRNPFRWSFDRQTQDMWIGDVGQNNWEEINFRASGATAGVNYGWRCYEGNSNFNTGGCGAAANYVFPVHVYPNPGSGSSAVTGGVVYRGLEYPAFQGYYFAADVYSNTVYLIKAAGAGTWTVTTQNGLPGTLACFGENEDGARNGESELTTVTLTEQQVRDLVERMLKSSGRRLDLSSPFVPIGTSRRIQVARSDPGHHP